jgi:hypothetical protein
MSRIIVGRAGNGRCFYCHESLGSAAEARAERPKCARFTEPLITKRETNIRVIRNG